MANQIEEAISALLTGTSLDDVLSSLLETISEEHQVLGKLKKRIRHLNALFPDKLEVLIRSKDVTSHRVKALEEAKKSFDDVKDYWLRFRVRHLKEVRESEEAYKKFDKAHHGLEHMLDMFAVANIIDTVIRAGMEVVESVVELKGQI